METRRRNNKTLEFEIGFFEGVLKNKPDYIEAMRALAELYTRTGKHSEGLKLDKRLSELLPRDATVYYNLACSYSLLGDVDSSFESIRKAIELGYNDISYMNNDPDLENLRKDKKFELLVSKKFSKDMFRSNNG